MSARPLTIDISRESELWRAEPGIDEAIGQAVASTLAVAGLDHLPDAELSLVLTDDAGIKALNGAWRAKDKPTNVLSFPAAPPGRAASSPMLGDIVFAHQTIAREAEALGLPFRDHFTHLVVHGLLHLFGHDHLDEAEAEAMESLETAVLARLGLHDPYSEPPLRAAS